MHLRTVTIALVLLTAASVAAAQPNATLDTPYQVRYAANLNIGESYINITNTGARGAGLAAETSAAVTGAICVNVYAFAPDEHMVSCCSCPVTPNGLVNLGAIRDLISNTLTLDVPTSIVIKLFASVPVAGSCANSASAPGAAAPGLAAWGTTIHLLPLGPLNDLPAVYSTVETAFTPATLSGGEFTRLTQLCTFINANGAGFGICRSCRLGGLGADRK